MVVHSQPRRDRFAATRQRCLHSGSQTIASWRCAAANTRNLKDIMPEIARLTTSDVPLVELRPYQCRFPVREDPSAPGGHLFCAGSTSPDRVYCDHHHSIA